MNMKSMYLALALCVSGPAMAMAVHASEPAPSRIANAIATFQSKSKAFMGQEDAGQEALPADDKVSKGETRLEVLEPIPEPETWALMAAGLGVIGLAARRRKSMRR